MKKIEYLKKIVLEVLGAPIYFLSKCTLRNKKIWVFGEWHGKKYSDNPKYLYEFVVSKNSDIKAIWITKDKVLLQILRCQGFKCEYAYGLKGLFYCLFAKYAFVSHGASDINQFVLGGCYLINLTHGTPLKRIGSDAKYKRLGKFTDIFDRYISVCLPAKKKFDFVFCADEVAKKRFQTSYDYKVVIKAFGYPRWRGLFLNSNINIDSYSKVISYLPTLRFNNHKQLDPLAFEGFDNFCDFLESNNYLLIIRPHPSMSFKREQVINKHVRFIRSQEVQDVNEVLSITDVLVSDFSSVIYDFEITGREIILLAPDALTYINEDVGIYGNYFKDFLFPIVNDWNDVIRQIQILTNENAHQVHDHELIINAPSEKICNFINRQ